jgi:hypothetical protein
LIAAVELGFELTKPSPTRGFCSLNLVRWADMSMILYRPVGIGELRLIARSGFREFPPRLPDQPIFYPVLTLEYARKIARDWNTVDAQSGYVGFVTRFEIDDETAKRYPVQVAGGRSHEELWVPAHELSVFNTHLIGTIAVIEAFTGTNFGGKLDSRTLLPVDL